MSRHRTITLCVVLLGGLSAAFLTPSVAAAAGFLEPVPATPELAQVDLTSPGVLLADAEGASTAELAAANVTAPPPAVSLNVSAVGLALAPSTTVPVQPPPTGVPVAQGLLQAAQADTAADTQVAALQPAPRVPATFPAALAPTTTTTAPAAWVMPDASVWACIRDHESGDNYGEATGNGFYGAYQFLPSTWDHVVEALGLAQYADGRPDLAPPTVQDQAAVWLQANSGWGQWPETSVACGV